MVEIQHEDYGEVDVKSSDHTIKNPSDLKLAHDLTPIRWKRSDNGSGGVRNDEHSKQHVDFVFLSSQRVSKESMQDAPHVAIVKKHYQAEAY